MEFWLKNVMYSNHSDGLKKGDICIVSDFIDVLGDNVSMFKGGTDYKADKKLAQEPYSEDFIREIERVHYNSDRPFIDTHGICWRFVYPVWQPRQKSRPFENAKEFMQAYSTHGGCVTTSNELEYFTISRADESKIILNDSNMDISYENLANNSWHFIDGTPCKYIEEEELDEKIN